MSKGIVVWPHKWTDEDDQDATAALWRKYLRAMFPESDAPDSPTAEEMCEMLLPADPTEIRGRSFSEAQELDRLACCKLATLNFDQEEVVSCILTIAIGIPYQSPNRIGKWWMQNDCRQLFLAGDGERWLLTLLADKDLVSAPDAEPVSFTDSQVAALLVASAPTPRIAGERLLQWRTHLIEAETAEERGRKLQELTVLLRADEDRLVIAWFERECPAQMASIPAEARPDFLKGICGGWQAEEDANSS